MDRKILRSQILSGSIARRLLRRAFMLASALSIIPLLQTLSGSDPLFLDSLNYDECDAPLMFAGTNLFAYRFLKPILNPFECKKHVNLTTNVVRELMDKQMLNYSAKTLCVGEGSASAVYSLRGLGFANVCGVYRHPFFSLKQRKLVYELEYADNSFDFVFSGDFDKASAPAIMVLEIERVLKPGGIGAMLVGVSGYGPDNLIRSATPISSLLKISSVVHVGYVYEFELVLFKKRIVNVDVFQQFQLLDDCQSVMTYRPLMENLEPLTENKHPGFEKEIAYLPKFIDVPSKKRLVYVEIGVSVTGWFLPSYPVDQKAFNVYFVDHNTSVLLSCVKKPGVTFIYYPGLAGDKATQNPKADHNPNVEDLDPSVEDEGFDFLAWFRETVEYADFVVLKMKVGEIELKFLIELFKSGTICLVDELFLSCSDNVDGKGLAKGECMDLFKSLRSSGVFVHQWWGD